MRFALAIILLASSAFAGIVDDVLAALNRDDFAGADRRVQCYRKVHGNTSDLANAIAWQARAALATNKLDRAASYADQTRQMSQPNVLGPRVDREQWLFALGASIEVQAQVMASKGETAEALLFLRNQPSLGPVSGSGSRRISTCWAWKVSLHRSLTPPSGSVPSLLPSPACAASRSCCSSGRTGVRTARLTLPSSRH
jgi:hypothetical protein